MMQYNSYIVMFGTSVTATRVYFSETAMILLIVKCVNLYDKHHQNIFLLIERLGIEDRTLWVEEDQLFLCRAFVCLGSW